jgi:hypothetical protein
VQCQHESEAVFGKSDPNAGMEISEHQMWRLVSDLFVYVGEAKA